MTAYYNEIDPFAAQWLRNLINAGHIAPGIVDERSIEDVHPSDLRGFTQCHFFAGIGVWSHALRSAGWGDDRPVWTGSCPCQPFSAAGQGAGFDDQRHLWPHFHHLIKECGPAIVLGEQVASKDADPWIDLVQADVEAMGYAFGAVPFPSASVGAPHIRDRLYWVAHAGMREPKQSAGAGSRPDEAESRRASGKSAGRCDSCGLAHLHGNRCSEAGQHFTETRGDGSVGDCAAGGMGHTDSKRAGRNGRPVCGALAGNDRQHGADNADAPGAFGGVAFSNEIQRGRRATYAAGINDWPQAGWKQGDGEPSGCGIRGIPRQPATGPTNGYWADADWLYCRDGRWRPVEPGTFPLAHGASARVGRLRAYGNAINAKAAQVFIECVMDCIE